MSAELLPTKVVFAAGDEVGVEVRGVVGTGLLRVTRLGDPVHETEPVGGGVHRLGVLPAGGYGVTWQDGSTVLRTALDVQADPRARHRYGFLAAYPPGRDVEPFSLALRRLHTTDVQLYDWAYRHADLLGGGREYRDALDQTISLDTVAALVGAAQAVGGRALGYAAVYGVGNDEWERWRAGAVLDAAGDPYSLGTFLRIVDPAWRPWLEHFVEDLVSSVRELGFDGFHLDQYGYPKVARRADGTVVDLARSFVEVVAAAREALPESRLVFNNVNDFDTRVTSVSPQDAVYIEPWAPTTSLGDLGAITLRARDAARGRPVVLAAYQSVYTAAPVEAADLATAFTAATLASHGATQLLTGEDDRILVDPYYVKNQQMEPSTEALLKAYADFLVEHDEVLLDPALDDVTASVVGEYNDDCDVLFEGIPVRSGAEVGTVWRRVTRAGSRLVMHLINLRGQVELDWDGPKQEPEPTGPGTLRVRAVRGSVPRVRVAEPLRTPTAVDVTVQVDGTHAFAVLPPVALWQVVIIDLA